MRVANKPDLMILTTVVYSGTIPRVFLTMLGSFLDLGSQGSKKVPQEVIFKGKGGIPKVVHLRGRPPRVRF